MFKMVTQQLRSIGEIISSVASFADDVATAFVRRVSPLMEETEEVLKSSVAVTMAAVSRLLEAAGDQLRAAERAHRLELRKEKELRIRRDKIAKKLYQALSKARKTFEGFGPGFSELAVGLDAYVSRADAEVLARYGRETLDLLSDPAGFTLPDGAENPGTFNAEEHADEIAPEVLALEGTLKELTRQKRQTQAAQKTKVDLLDTLKKTYTYGARTLEGIYVLAGEEFHADRLRPPVRSQTDSGDAEIPLPEDEEPTGAEPPAEDGEPILTAAPPTS